MISLPIGKFSKLSKLAKHSLYFQHKLSQLFLFLAFSLFCFVLVEFRVAYSGYLTYSFLLWNLFLAWIPYLISFALTFFPSLRLHKLLSIGLIALWLLFFPNAPYILTDLFHLQERPIVPIWFDLALILSFALHALFLAFVSLSDLHDYLASHYHKYWAWAFSFISLVLSGFGIYLGRYLRWNSWDLLTNPKELIKDIGVIFANPTIYVRPYAMTLVFAILLIFCFLLVRSFRWRNAKKNV